MTDLKAALSTSTAVGLALFIALPAYAADAPAGGDRNATAGDIIVTARRIEERLQDVPISITVMNQQQLAEHNVINAEDLAKTTPSLQVNSQFGSANTMFSIRGFSQDIGTLPTVGVYFGDVVAPRGGSNGTPAGDGAGAGSLFDLQNVQILKGPQGTLEGRNTTGGAVMLVPQKPTHKLEGYVEGTLGDYGARGIQAVLNMPLGDSFRMRLGVDRQLRDGYVHNLSGIGPGDFDDVNYTAVRASLVADLTPDLENYTIISYANSNTHGHVQKLISVTENGPLSFLALPELQAESGTGFYDAYQSLPDAGQRTNSWQIINTTTWRQSDALTVRNIASYAELRQSTNSPLFGLNFNDPFPAVTPNPPYSVAAGAPIYYAISHAAPGLDTTAEATFTEELRFQGRGLSNRLKWQGGLYFEESTPLGLTGIQTATFAYCQLGLSLTPSCYGLSATGSGYNYQVARTSYKDEAIYAQGTYALTPKLSLTAGLRYTWDTMTSNASEYFTTVGGFDQTFTYNPPTVYCIQTWLPAPGGTCPTASLQNKSKAPTWLIDLDYKPAENVLAYAKYSRGYRAGGVKNDAPNLSLDIPGGQNFEQYQPEKLDAYEVGLKTEFRGVVNGTFNVAGFYNQFSNQQVMLGVSNLPGGIYHGPPTSAPVNIGQSRIYGLEVDTTLNLFQGFNLTFGYTYLDSKVTQLGSYPSPDPVHILLTALAVLGQPLDLTPKNKFSISGSYTLPLDDGVGRISLGATFTHTDSQISTFGDGPDIAASGPQLVPGATAPLVNNTDFGRLQATNLLDLNVEWKGVAGKPLDLAFFATNVTNQHYYSWVPGLLGYGYETASLGAPAMYGFRAKVRF